MPKELWNEGRVVGYSAYEMYVRHALAVDPGHKPASEKEWLASMMAMGSSMLLKVGKDPDGTSYDTVHYRDIPLPADSRLCAANTITASLFVGKSDKADDNTTSEWCTKVTDYGPLISNTSSSSPNGTLGYRTSVPSKSISSKIFDEYKQSIREYANIIDGIVIQPGKWEPNPDTPPAKDFEPSLSAAPMLRIAFRSRVTSTFYILFTGFTNRSVVDGQTGFGSAVNTPSPADGDFLGPWQFPWANKIIFTVPSVLAEQFKPNIGVKQGSDGKPLIAFTEVDDKHIDALSMADEVGTLYALNGNSGSVDLELKYKSTDNYISRYEGSFTWETLINMLHFNKKCSIKLEIKSVDPNNFTAIDITPVLLNSCTDGVSALFKFGKDSKIARLKIPDTGDGWDNLDTVKYDGYFRMIIKLNTTEVGTTSKFTIELCALLKKAITFISTESNTRWDSGFYWRGNFNNDDIRPIFGTEPPGYQSNLGTPITKTGVCEGINRKLHKTFKADSTGINWGLDLTFSASPLSGDNNDPIVLIDKSYNYGGDIENPGNLSLIVGANVNNIEYTYKSANGISLRPTLSDRSLSLDEYTELIDNSAVVRSCSGVYSI
ncbi:MAG: YbdD/YjiX family protein [Clostridium sp.]|nr:YbdD/YjiX family protein [Clostridium sp.]